MPAGTPIEDADPKHPRPISRRRFLERSAMAVAGSVLFSCTGGSVIPRVGPSSSPAMRLDTRWPIKRVISLMLENRSFDNLFGPVPRRRGTRVGNMLGQDEPLLRCPDWLPGDLPHDRNPYSFPSNFPDWPPGTVPVTNPFG